MKALTAYNGNAMWAQQAEAVGILGLEGMGGGGDRAWQTWLPWQILGPSRRKSGRSTTSPKWQSLQFKIPV
jgi:hypothetical protein